MAIINNQAVIKELLKSTKIDANIEKVPDSFSSSIVPVIEINPALTKRADLWYSVSSAATFIVVPTGKIFVLTSASLSYSKTAADTGTALTLTGFDSSGSSSKAILALAGTTSIQEAQSITLASARPIECYAGAIAVAAAGTFSGIRATISGFYIDSP